MNVMLDPYEPELTEIPGGEFEMGDIWGDGEVDEQPVAARYCDSFLLGKYAVTNSQFVWFLNNADGNVRPGECFADLQNKNNRIYIDGRQFTCEAGFEDHPATYVNWIGASAYCAWLSEKMGLSVRLPSELEWQYAAMGQHKLKWSLGDIFNKKDYICGNDGAARVDFGAPSDWGLFNMTGNVFEWCNNEYHFSLTDSPDNVLRNNRVIKGGAFILRDSTNLRNAKRFSCHEGSCISSIGFRVAVSRTIA
jgi:formylglycine-generating enzyme required for sulfatase activity